MSQQFRLRRNSHLANLLSIFKSFQSSDILVDVTLSCEGHNIKAHKVILSACSPYFESLFTENPCQHPIVIINGMKFEIVRAIMDFIYKGDVNVSQDKLAAFLRAAESLQIKGLEAGSTENNLISAQGMASQVETAAPQPQPVGSPLKRRNRARKRSLSDCTKSDEEVVIKKEPMSPEIQDLSGDEYFSMCDMKSNLNSHPYSMSQQSTRCIIREPDSDEEYEMESSKLMKQTLTANTGSSTNNQANASLSISSERLEKKMRGTPDTESSNVQGPPESPPDVKPIIQFEDSSEAGNSEGAMALYNEQSLSQPGPSNYQDNSSAHQEGSQAHGIISAF